MVPDVDGLTYVVKGTRNPLVSEQKKQSQQQHVIQLYSSTFTMDFLKLTPQNPALGEVVYRFSRDGLLLSTLNVHAHSPTRTQQNGASVHPPRRGPRPLKTLLRMSLILPSSSSMTLKHARKENLGYLLVFPLYSQASSAVSQLPSSSQW